MRFWDLAASEPTSSNPDPDWTVGTLMLFNQGIAYILDVRRQRVKNEKVEQLIAQTAQEDGHSVAIRIEQEPGSSGKALIDQYARYVLPGTPNNPDVTVSNRSGKWSSSCQFVAS